MNPFLTAALHDWRGLSIITLIVTLAIFGHGAIA
jgi:hypothetical protein